MPFLYLFDTQRNEFPINLGSFQINYFLPKLVESCYGEINYRQLLCDPNLFGPQMRKVMIMRFTQPRVNSTTGPSGPAVEILEHSGILTG